MKKIWATFIFHLSLKTYATGKDFLFVSLVKYFVSCFRMERQNTKFTYSKKGHHYLNKSRVTPRSPLFPEKSWQVRNKPLDIEWKWELEIPANCSPWVCRFAYYAKKLPVNKALLILTGICWLLRKEVLMWGFKISDNIENTFCDIGAGSKDISVACLDGVLVVYSVSWLAWIYHSRLKCQDFHC